MLLLTKEKYTSKI